MPKIFTAQENVKDVYIMLQDRRVIIRRIIEDACLLYHMVYNIFTVELEIKSMFEK